MWYWIKNFRKQKENQPNRLTGEIRDRFNPTTYIVQSPKSDREKRHLNYLRSKFITKEITTNQDNIREKCAELPTDNQLPKTELSIMNEDHAKIKEKYSRYPTRNLKPPDRFSPGVG
ncbi:unnamed protein product [Gordionus sp. m RMFG-2023]